MFWQFFVCLYVLHIHWRTNIPCYFFLIDLVIDRSLINSPLIPHPQWIYQVERAAVSNHYLFLSHFKFTDSANCTVWFRKEKYHLMGLKVLNKHHCNSQKVFTVCFISASAKNTYRAGLIHYSIILKLNTMGKYYSIISNEPILDSLCLLQYTFLLMHAS